MKNKGSEKVVVLGLGYVGLSVALRAASAGMRVVGYDTDSSRVALLASGQTEFDDCPSTQLESCLGSGYFVPTTESSSLADFSAAVIAVSTPVTDGAPDHTNIVNAAQTLAKYLTVDSLVILESTTCIGTTELIVTPLLEAGSGLRASADFYVGYSPERIDPGNDRWTLENTPKLIAGIDERSAECMRGFYRRFVQRTVTMSGTREAEMAKLLENTFRYVNIALVNEIAMWAHDQGVNIWEVIDAASTKPFGFIPFHPGPGIGGHCLPASASYLSWSFEQESGVPCNLVRSAHNVNGDMNDYTALRLQAGLHRRGKKLQNCRILIIGVTYKRNSRDHRNSPAIGIINSLIAQGASIIAHDPLAEPAKITSDGIEWTDLTVDVISSCDVALILADHDVIDFDMICGHSSYVFDTRGRLSGPNVELL